MVFILSTLGLWRLHCETLRTQCKACLSLLGCEYILMCTSMSHTQKKNYQYWQKGYLHKSIYTPASCDVSVYQYQCTALKLADIFLISEPQIIPTTFFPALYSPVLIDVHLPALKTSFKCPVPPSPNQPKLYDQLSELHGCEGWCWVASKKKKTQIRTTPVFWGNLTNSLFIFHNSCSKADGFAGVWNRSLCLNIMCGNCNSEPFFLTEISPFTTCLEGFTVIHNYNRATNEIIA